MLQSIIGKQSPEPADQRAGLDELTERIRSLMLQNTKEGYSRLLGQNYCYVQPAPGNYPFQWWWDTCFHVFTLCALREFALAKRNLQSLFAAQEENGFVGHMIFWLSSLPRNRFNVLQARPTVFRIRPHMSSLIQPPLVAQALRQFWQDTGDQEFLIQILPKLKRYFDWLAANREPDGDGLIAIISPFESGLDWKPSYDEPIGLAKARADDRLFRAVVRIDMANFLRRYHLPRIFRARRFCVKDVLVNTMYVEDLRALAELCRATGDPDAVTFESRAARTEQAILRHMYDRRDDAFYDLYGSENRMSKVLTFTIGQPIILAATPDEIASRIIERHFMNAEEFNLPFPVPSVARTEPAFETGESKFLWRGPTWVPINWFCYTCLIRKGFADLAATLLSRVLMMVQRSGFREYYDPFTGEGYGAQRFTWSGLVLDMIRRAPRQQWKEDAARSP
jgi:glycogen debranching enzyme